MTRKDYKMIAKAIVETFNETDMSADARLNLAWKLALEFALDNPNFDKQKFFEACSTD